MYSVNKIVTEGILTFVGEEGTGVAFLVKVPHGLPNEPLSYFCHPANDVSFGVNSDRTWNDDIKVLLDGDYFHVYYRNFVDIDADLAFNIGAWCE